MKLAVLFLLIYSGYARAERPVSQTAAAWTERGRSWFLDCEFHKAAGAFEKALEEVPEDAGLYHWLGKSQARLADISNPWSAAREARRAQRSLERAVKLEPGNAEYVRDLFDFYLDSAEFSAGMLERAALLLRRTAAADAAGNRSWEERLAEAHRDNRGGGCLIRKAILLPVTQAGRLVP